MPRFLAVYTMQPETLANYSKKPKAEQDAVDADGYPKWIAWEERNAKSLPHRSAMVGKTLRVNQAGIAPATNNLAGYIVVEAETIEAAAELFRDHPHFAIFPGDGVDIMPLLTGPDA